MYFNGIHVAPSLTSNLTGIPSKYIEDFMREVFETPEHLLNSRDVIKIPYSDVYRAVECKKKNPKTMEILLST